MRMPPSDCMVSVYRIECQNARAPPRNSAARQAMSFPPSAACKFLDLPPVNLRNLHLTKNPFAGRPPHLCGVAFIILCSMQIVLPFGQSGSDFVNLSRCVPRCDQRRFSPPNKIPSCRPAAGRPDDRSGQRSHSRFRCAGRRTRCASVGRPDNTA